MNYLSCICVIADHSSVRFPYLESQIKILSQLCNNIEYIYKYTESNIPSEVYKDYYGLFPYYKQPTYKLNYSEYCSIRGFAVVLNHLECLMKIDSFNDKCSDDWSLICEDDILIDDMNNFKDKFLDILNNKPNDADILWISSGKKDLNCTYRDVVGSDPDKSLNYDQNTTYWKIPRSRYGDCILLKNSVANKLLSTAKEYKISYPIDWEYTFWLMNDTTINSYWLQPAIIRQNPIFFT